MGRSYQTRRNKEARRRVEAMARGDAFAKETFMKLREDDSCWNRLLRFLRLKKPMNLAIMFNERCFQCGKEIRPNVHGFYSDKNGRITCEKCH